MLSYVVLPYLILGVVGGEKYWWSARLERDAHQGLVHGLAFPLWLGDHAQPHVAAVASFQDRQVDLVAPCP